MNVSFFSLAFLFLYSFNACASAQPRPLDKEKSDYYFAKLTHEVDNKKSIDLCQAGQDPQSGQTVACKIGHATHVQLQNDQCYEMRNGILQPISRKNMLESCRGICADTLKSNVPINWMSWLACGYYVHSFVMLLGKPIYTPLSFGYHIMGAIFSTGAYKLSSDDNGSKALESLGTICLLGAVAGFIDRK